MVLLATALADYARDGADDSRISEVLTRLVAEAHERAIPPEEVLVELKTVWNGLPVSAVRSHGNEQSRLLQHVVTMCIKSYYR